MTSSPTLADRKAADARRPDHRWLILVVVSIAQLMVVLDATVVNIALPSAQADLGFADGQRQWIVTAYALAFGSLLLFGGRVGDMFGRKRVFLGGLVAFALASAIGGAAPSFGVLVTARALQGVAGAMLAPAALSTLVTTFREPHERGRAFGVFGTVAVGGGAVGLILGGILTEYLSWRWVMYVNVLFAAAAGIGAVVYMVHERPAVRARIDVVGTVLASAGLFGLVFGFSHAESAGWTSGVTVASLVLGVVLLVGFAFAEQHVGTPLLPLRVVADRSRAVAFAAVAVAGLAMFGLFLFLTYYLQQVKGFSPVMSGLAFLPMIGCVMISSNLSNIVTLPRFGPRVVITIGMVVGSLALLYLSRLDVSSSYAAGVLPSLIFMGFAMGMVMAPSMNTATAGVQPQDSGVASALVSTMQQVGGSIGTAVLSTIVASVTTSYADTHRSLGAAVAAQAQTHGYTVAFAISAGTFAAGAIMGVLLFPSKRRLAELRAVTADAAHRATATSEPVAVGAER
ncbi:drug resistance transporter, EmrB/QacA subfamily [Jatrophihabitans endophyticus]|uniref:Drug resistance transporter, EmrB/QacA subfamily n=1 Tax=Jatrophihabitans endophyticus TaxID=1206085 RepID=A0A1M5KIB4_9ACTN|nr:MFS transporter [Jatrophihabitans endophyticus]SHG52458.1 drug resistance transporter, EmrB/QacA subfamily [Jatrophihabitans endophyticus]